MESISWNWEQKTLISELIQGMELTKQLKANIDTTTTSVETRDLILQKILSSYEKALLILNWSGSSMGQHQQTGGAAATGTGTGASPVSESPISRNGSPRSDDFDGGHKENQLGCTDASKKRKTSPRWTDRVRVSSENGLEGSHDDGHSWRKYGQKDILGAKYPRSYYRCTYRSAQNCWATKQVQRSDEDPTVFDVTYRGMHVCSHGNQAIPPPASPEKKEGKQNSDNFRSQQSQDVLINFQKSLRINTEALDNKEMVSPFSFPSTYGYDNGLISYSPPFISPVTPEPNYCSVSPFLINNYAGAQNFQRLDSDFNEIISASTSATNSPIMDFTLEHVEFPPNYPFDNSGFFS